MEKIVTRRTFDDGTAAYELLRYDSTDFMVKMSKSTHGLARTILVPGPREDIAGRLGNTLWVSYGEEGSRSLRVVNLDDPAPTNRSAAEFRQVSILLCEYVSRLGWSLITYGVEVPIGENVVISNGVFSFRDGDSFL